MERSISDINKKINSGKVFVLTAQEAKKYIKENGLSEFLNTVDIVTCSSFEMQVNALLYLSFGQTDPLIYFDEVYLNNIPTSVCGPTDIAIALSASSSLNPKYSGANLIEDLINKKDIHLKATGKNYEVYKNLEFETWFNLNDVNIARLFLNQVINQNNIVACNAGSKDINSPFGTLIGNLENSTYNSSSYINPLINDPFCQAIGIGTNIWISGGKGIVTGYGTNHNPKQKRNKKDIPVGPSITLSAVCDLFNIIPKFMRAGHINSFGSVLYVGAGIPIPILNESIAKGIEIEDSDIETVIVDYSIPRRGKPILGTCNYRTLRTSTIDISGKSTLCAPLSSMSYAMEISEILKDEILNKSILLTENFSPLNLTLESKKLDSRLGV